MRCGVLCWKEIKSGIVHVHPFICNVLMWSEMRWRRWRRSIQPVTDRSPLRSQPGMESPTAIHHSHVTGMYLKKNVMIWIFKCILFAVCPGWKHANMPTRGKTCVQIQHLNPSFPQTSQQQCNKHGPAVLLFTLQAACCGNAVFRRWFCPGQRWSRRHTVKPARSPKYHWRCKQLPHNRLYFSPRVCAEKSMWPAHRVMYTLLAWASSYIHRGMAVAGPANGMETS